VALVHYEYYWLTNKITIDNIHLARIEDIASMKLKVIIGIEFVEALLIVTD